MQQRHLSSFGMEWVWLYLLHSHSPRARFKMNVKRDDNWMLITVKLLNQQINTETYLLTVICYWSYRWLVYSVKKCLLFWYFNYSLWWTLNIYTKNNQTKKKPSALYKAALWAWTLGSPCQTRIWRRRGLLMLTIQSMSNRYKYMKCNNTRKIYPGLYILVETE